MPTPDTAPNGDQDRIPTTAATGVYATDPDAFTEAWYRRRAVAWADDARKLVALVVDYEECHPDDAPCLEPLLRAVPGVAWRDHDAVSRETVTCPHDRQGP